MRPCVCLAFIVTSSAYSLGAGVSPVQKVISMLNDMRSKGVKEKQDEQVQFAAYKQFCDDTSAAKKASIDDANAQIEQLQADIQKAESDAAELARDIAALDSDIRGWSQDKEEATRQREEGNADFSVTHKDYSESIDSLARAGAVLRSQSFDRKQGKALLQKVSVMARVPAKARRVIASFLATDTELRQDPLAVSAPQANAYEFQSGGVVDMLQELHDKFEDELRTLEKEEMEAEHAFKLMVLSLENQMATAKKEREAKAGTKADREEAAAAARGELADTTAARDEDSTYLDSLTAQCSQKSMDFEARQQLRAEELEAIQKAVEIISSGELSGNAAKHLDRERSFVLRGSAEHLPLQRRVAAFLQARADKVGSRLLSMVAVKVEGDTFVKVRKMIDDMITRLLEEASEEEDHKGWCDTEMAKNKHTRDTKTEDINALQAKVDKLSSTITRLAQEMSDLTDAISEVDKAVVEATNERKEEKAKNKEAIEDTRDAQTAVAQALAVLKDFYNKAAAGAENMKIGYDGRLRFLQGQAKAPEDDSPETWDSEPYTGMGDNAGGVVGLLEVIGSDFARVEAETEESESEAAKAYERFMVESSKDKAVKTADLEHKAKSKTERESELNDTRKDLAGTQQELDAALVYHENLKPSCNTATVSYDDRVAKREGEIESLKEALQILSDTGR